MTIKDILKEKLKDIKFEIYEKDILTLCVDKEDILKVLKILRNEKSLIFDYLIDVTACDYIEEGQFEVIYHLFSFLLKKRVRVKTVIKRDNPELISASEIYPAARWFEREIYDLFGIRFLKHPNLKRILLWESFPGYPLRKDYILEREGPIPELEDIY